LERRWGKGKGVRKKIKMKIKKKMKGWEGGGKEGESGRGSKTPRQGGGGGQ